MLTVLTTSVNYADYLAETLPYTKELADRVIVITSITDGETNRICGNHGVEAFNTEAFFRNGAVFAKGSAINAALQYYRDELADQWLLYLDADVLAPALPALVTLDKAWLYGMQRKAIIGRESLEFYQRHGRTKMCHARTISKPIGFFQLWHSSHWKDYPALSDNASWDDIEFVRQFAQYRMLGQVFHLQTSDLRRRGNWDGRTTKAF